MKTGFHHLAILVLIIFAAFAALSCMSGSDDDDDNDDGDSDFNPYDEDDDNYSDDDEDDDQGDDEDDDADDDEDDDEDDDINDDADDDVTDCDGDCQGGYLSECTCDPSDPCGWIDDGHCDYNNCMDNFDFSFDDRESDCGGVDDDVPDDVWVDPDTGIWWLYEIVSGYLEDDAYIEDFCESLNFQQYEGYYDWRLPTISELRSIIRGCSATMPGGSCGVTDECTDEGDCFTFGCNGCPWGEGPDLGWYVASEIHLEDYHNRLWSSSVDSFTGGYIRWLVDYAYGSVVWGVSTLPLSSRVMCVRD